MNLLAPKDAARRLGVTTSRVIQLDREGRLHAIRDSAGRRLFRSSDVDKLVGERQLADRARRLRQPYEGQLEKLARALDVPVEKARTLLDDAGSHVEDAVGQSAAP